MWQERYGRLREIEDALTCAIVARRANEGVARTTAVRVDIANAGLLLCGMLVDDHSGGGCLRSCKRYHHRLEVDMTSAWCVQCGYPTGSGLCLTCRGELPRSCANCDVDLPTVWYDILCLPCTEAEGSAYMADVQARKERSAYLRACEDCGRPTYADAGPLCPICRFRREGFGFVV